MSHEKAMEDCVVLCKDLAQPDSIRHSRNRPKSGPVPAILTGIFETRDRIIVQYYLPCGGYYELSNVIIDIESNFMDEWAARRVTFLAMTVWPEG